MFDAIKKTCIVTLFIGCTLLPMDPPVKDQKPFDLKTLAISPKEIEENIAIIQDTINLLSRLINPTPQTLDITSQIQTESVKMGILLQKNVLYEQKILLAIEQHEKEAAERELSREQFRKRLGSIDI